MLIGHMTIAIMRNGEMQICESNAKTEFWPVNGVQCNRYEDWINYAQNAEYQFLWAPLDRSIHFDIDKANAFIDTVIGVDYGFEILLTGWLDTVRDNLPCRRGNVNYCFLFNEKEYPED